MEDRSEFRLLAHSCRAETSPTTSAFGGKADSFSTHPKRPLLIPSRQNLKNELFFSSRQKNWEEI